MDNQSNRNNYPRLLTTAETAAFLSISRGTLYRLIDQRKIRFYKIAGTLRFRREDLEQYIESGCIEPISYKRS